MPERTKFYQNGAVLVWYPSIFEFVQLVNASSAKRSQHEIGTITSLEKLRHKELLAITTKKKQRSSAKANLLFWF